MSRSRLAWGIAGLDIVSFLVVGLSDPAEPIGAVALYVIGIGSLAAVGALLWARVPANPIGALLLAAWPGTRMDQIRLGRSALSIPSPR